MIKNNITQEQIKKKKEFLDNLYYETGQQFDFEVCSLNKDEQGNSHSLWKWAKYSLIGFDVEKNIKKFTEINCRSILPNEVVIDIESKENIDKILSNLDKAGFHYECYDTGSRGYHIHLFFNQEVKEDFKEQFIKKFGGDITKKSKRNVIALENWPHWKTGKIKTIYKQT